MYVLVRTKRQRKRKFFLIDFVVGLLVAFSVSMKAGVRSYRKRVSVFGCLHSVFLMSPFSKFPLWSPDSIVCIFILRFHHVSVNGKPKWREKFVFSSKNVLV